MSDSMARFSSRPTSLPFLGLGTYFVASIFYVFPSGNPQPADGLLVLTMAFSLFGIWRLWPSAANLYSVLAIWCCWIALINSIWYCLIGDITLMKKTSFYLFNAIVLVFVITAGFNDWKRLKDAVRWACIAALVVQLIYIAFIADAQYKASLRETGGFNNPNQLGYWALLIMASLAVVKEGRPLSLSDIGALAAGMYLLMLSLSKAATISGALLIALIMVFCRIKRAPALALGAALIAMTAIEFSYGGLTGSVAETNVVTNITHRLSKIGTQRDDSLEERGYGRLSAAPQWLAFGAGEGGFSRFTGNAPWDSGKEFHSTLGTVLMSYGIIGLCLFVLLLLALFYRAPLASWAYCVPIMLYGVTHVGLRFTEFWIFLGLVYAQSRWGNKGG